MVFTNSLPNNTCAEVRDFKQRLHSRCAYIFFNGFDVVTYTGHHLTAVSPGAAIPKMAGFQNDNISDPLLRQFQRGIDA
ncbi:Uncharacterised protein [Salmonella enterica subsp. enterica serovar Bovismorbificans]|nr:Uncharacterised protein [Salmonella enterica subsp. enterica serovar Bovismorbificans]